MRRRTLLLTGVLWIAATACEPAGSSPASELPTEPPAPEPHVWPPPAEPRDLPAPTDHDLELTKAWLGPDTVNAEALSFWLAARKYRAWASSSSVAPTPQGGSRVYVSDVLANSLVADAAVHPVGTVAVRELYTDDLTTLQAINVTVKRHEDDGDRSGWLFIEFTDLALGGIPSVFEHDAPGCVACHGRNADIVESAWPLP